MTSPDYRVIHTRTSNSENKISGRHMHIFYHFIAITSDHAADPRHPPHAGTELEITLLLDVDTPLFIQAVFLPHWSVFH